VTKSVLADRIHRFAAPVWVVYRALTKERSRWLPLNPGEVEPVVLNAVEDSHVVWSSFWPVSPEDRIEFDLSSDGEGTALRFRWLTSSPPDERGINITRQRLNRKLGDVLRGWIDSPGHPISWDRN
jgi:hypothetical protein